MVQARDILPERELGPVLSRAAAALRDTGRSTPPDAAAGRALRELGYAAPLAAGENEHWATLLQTASGFRRLFQIASPHAPGLVFVGAEIGHGASASGVGASLRAAFEGCVGEAAEYLSQCEAGTRWRADGEFGLRAPLRTQAFAELWQPFEADAVLDWVRARRLSDAGPAWVPADLCLRREAGGASQASVGPLSVGCAAGVSLRAAALHGLLELVERNAVWLWWHGGQRGRTLAPPQPAAVEAARLLAAIRRGQSARQAWLLDITTDLGVPTVAALSCDPDGGAVAAGFAARPKVAAASRAALFEMCLIELATDVALAKRRERGEAALAATDRQHLRRASQLNARSCDLLHPLGPSARTEDMAAPEPGAVLDDLAARLLRRGAEAFAVDLTVAVPVAHVLCPALRRDVSDGAWPF